VAQIASMDATWANIEGELQRRHDLVPNLVETVQGYAATSRRSSSRSPRPGPARSPPAPSVPIEQQARAEDELTAAADELLAVTESYPELRSDAVFRDLQRQLVETEDRIAAARRLYNLEVAAYERRRRSVPSNLVAHRRLPARRMFEIRDPPPPRPARPAELTHLAIPSGSDGGLRPAHRPLLSDAADVEPAVRCGSGIGRASRPIAASTSSTQRSRSSLTTSTSKRCASASSSARGPAAAATVASSSVPPSQPPLELLEARGQEEHEQRVGVLLLDLQRALDLDVEDDDRPRRDRLDHRLPAGCRSGGRRTRPTRAAAPVSISAWNRWSVDEAVVTPSTSPARGGGSWPRPTAPRRAAPATRAWTVPLPTPRAQRPRPAGRGLVGSRARPSKVASSASRCRSPSHAPAVGAMSSSSISRGP
jgi:LemA protein